MSRWHGLRVVLGMAALLIPLVGCATVTPPDPLPASALTPLLLSADAIGFTPETTERALEASGQETAIGVGLVPHSATGECGKSIAAVKNTTFTPVGSSAQLFEAAGASLALGLYSLGDSLGEQEAETGSLYTQVLNDCPMQITDREFLTKYAFAPLPDAMRQRGVQGYVVTVHDPVSEGPTHSYVAHLPLGNHGVYLGATGVAEEIVVDAFLQQAEKLAQGLS